MPPTRSRTCSPASRPAPARRPGRPMPPAGPMSHGRGVSGLTMAAAQDGAPKARAAPRKRPGLLRRIVRHRADYLYIAPAFAVMLLVIGYPIYDTINLSFFNTPPSLAMADKVYVGLDNYERILTSASFREVTVNT